MQIAQAFNHPVVSDADTTETEQLVAQPNGTWEFTESSVPVRTSVDGGWTPIDTTLATASSGMLAPRASAVPVEFSNGGSGPLARVQAASGQWLSESWAAGVLPQPSVDGDTATYADVMPGVDLQLRAGLQGMAEVLVVKSAQAARDPQLADVRFGLNGGGLKVSTSAGAVDATPTDGSAGVHSGTATWWDSSSTGASAAGPGDLGTPRPVQSTVSTSAVTVDAASAAEAAGATYPVFVDPDWNGGVWHRTFVDSAYPTTAYYNGAGASDTYQHVGYIDAGHSDDGRAHLTRSIWDMDTHGMVGTHVLSAHFNATEVYSSSCTATPVELWITSGVDATTTWNNQPTWGGNRGSVNAAYGYSSSCPAQKIGWDVTADAQNVADRGQVEINLGLKAPSSYESNWLSWKKFDAHATLTATFNSIPEQPITLRVGGCSFVCSEPAYTKDNSPSLQAQSHDPDSGTLLTFTFQVWIYGHTTPTASGVVTGVPSGPGHLAFWSPPPLADGAYSYRVFASDGTDTSPDAGFKFVVDTVPPAQPTLTPSGPLGLTSDGNGGHVGSDTETVNVKPAVNDHAWGYVYGVFPTAAPPVFPTNPVCNTTVNGFTVVCPGATGGVGTDFNASVAAIDDNSTFAVEAFDAAGNVPSVKATQSFYAFADSVSPQSGHGWSTTGDFTVGHGCTDPVTDIPGSSAAALNLALSGSVCWASSTVPATSGTNVLSFTGSAASVTTGTTALPNAPALADTSKSFTVGAWLSSPTITAGTAMTALAQDGTNESSFFLENSNNHWALCMPTSNATTWAGDCVSTSVAINPNTWTWVVGTWDAVNKQIRISATTDGSAATPTVASHAAAWASTGSLYVGRDKIGTAYRYWRGLIADPVVVPGVLDSVQTGELGQHMVPGGL